MDAKTWHNYKWPEGVPHKISRYDKPLFSILDDVAREFPDSTFTIFNGAKRTFKSVKDTADRIADFLIPRGIKALERVAIFLPNILQYSAIFFGILKTGAACVTCNPSYKPRELNLQLNVSDARAVFVMDHVKFYATALEALKGTDVQTVVICDIRSCGSGAGSLPLEIIKQFEEKTGAIVFEGYGLSETSPVLTVNPTNREQRKIGSVGLPMPNIDVKIVVKEIFFAPDVKTAL